MQKRKILRSALLAGVLITLLAFTSSCIAAGESGQSSLADYSLIIFMVVIIGFMYWTSSRSRRKQQKKHEEMMAELRRGDRIITTSGVFGQIESIDDISAVIKVESGATLRITKASIAGKRQE